MLLISNKQDLRFVEIYQLINNHAGTHEVSIIFIYHLHYQIWQSTLVHLVILP